MKVAFKGFVLDAAARRLTNGGRDIHLSPKAFDLLVLLAEARPAVVDKATIRARLWPGIHVVGASLTNLVTEIRSELGAEAGERAVRTVDGVGYAFGGEIEDPRAAGSQEPPAPYWLVLDERPLRLATGENLIGRDPSSAVWLDAASVSRRHAVVRVADVSGPVIIEDLGSTNGTYVGRRRVTSAELQDADRIRIGDVTLVFRARPGEGKTRRVRRTREDT